MWPSTTFPNGHLLCDGQTFDPLVYPQLRAVLGVNRLPDLRGQFIRGWGAPSGPSSTAPILNQAGYATARPTTEFTGVTDTSGGHHHDLATRDGASVYAHIEKDNTNLAILDGHNNWSVAGNAWRIPGGSFTWVSGAHSHTLRINGGGDNETRPVNTLLAFIIKALP
jgi:hypothetical protein